MKRPNGTSLLTVCNHLSYIDDPAFYRKGIILYMYKTVVGGCVSFSVCTMKQLNASYEYRH